MPSLKFVPAPPRSAEVMPVLTLREVVLFPHTISPLFVGREASMKAVEAAYSNAPARSIFLVLQKDGEAEGVDDPGNLNEVGVVARVVQILRIPDGSMKVLFEGLYRATFSDYAFNGSHYTACATEVPDTCLNPKMLEAAGKLACEELGTYAKTSRKISQEVLNSLLATEDAAAFADSVAARLTSIDYHRKQKLLELQDVSDRVEAVYAYLSGEASVASLEKKIKAKVREQMDQSQRTYYLNEQLKVINKELGREDDPMKELEELTEKVKANEYLPEAAREKALSELKKLGSMTSAAAEYTILRSYVDWILALPWNKLSDVDIDIEEARRILDSEHFGLEKPKERIIEYLAVQKLSNGLRGPILCLVGPPGVGKTSLAKSVAKATGREYVRLALGGVRDEAEIRGHRRTYVGALPGKILQSMKRVSHSNPLFCLDEIDKLASDYRGDPAAALLEVLDPEQNCTFLDHYLDLDYDLSKVFFITTANSLDTIPAPLLDRMEVIELSSYLETEKIHIARDFLIPRQQKENGLEEGTVKISDKALSAIIRDYTAEAGVRTLERRIAKICRKTAVRLLTDKNPARQYSVNPTHLAGLLGTQTYVHSKRDTEAGVGVCTGLAWTARGGEILFIETSLMPGKGSVVTTGKLGDVMQESAKAAFTWVRAHACELGLAADFYNKVDLHVHVPDGATPKDGPSAGITIATAIASALLGIPVRTDVAMTGEISLRGRVLPIGGLREKILGAKRADIFTVIIPKDNEKDLRDVPAEVLKGMEIIPVSRVDEVLEIALDAPRESIFSGNAATTPLYMTLRSNYTDAETKEAKAN